MLSFWNLRLHLQVVLGCFCFFQRFLSLWFTPQLFRALHNKKSSCWVFLYFFTLLSDTSELQPVNINTESIGQGLLFYAGLVSDFSFDLRTADASRTLLPFSSRAAGVLLECRLEPGSLHFPGLGRQKLVKNGIINSQNLLSWKDPTGIIQSGSWPFTGLPNNSTLCIPESVSQMLLELWVVCVRPEFLAGTLTWNEDGLFLRSCTNALCPLEI